MKKILFLFLVAALSLTMQAQLKTTAVCPAFTVDILKGRVNTELMTTSSIGQIKAKFPCFTRAEDESDSAKCGGGVFYKDKDIYFYTARDYIEIGPNFKGKLSVPLIGANRNALFKWLGNPRIKDVNWDAFQTAYGVLILYYNKAGKINKIQFSVQGTDNIKLCE
ncbi:MAG TPA: hypothetical protein VI461_07905 [Chitinophagaceae bacterium]|nr:hypothetical protein [Chitinophagaceae bacterium]